MPRNKSTKPSAAASLPPPREVLGGPTSLTFGNNTNQFANQQTSFDAFGNHDMPDFNFDEEMFNENMEEGVFDGSQGEFHMSSAMFGADLSNVDSAKFSQFSQGNGSMGGQSGPPPTASSAQSGIVNQRRDQVREQFGQITPPDETTPELDAAKAQSTADAAQRSEEEIARANRAQRARNAANKRHSKSKKRKDSAMEDGTEEAEDDAQGKTTSVQREKNRVAAAKCRAKKKATSEEMQDVHREGAKTNSMLHREMRELRDQKAFLRNTLLQHEPGVCQCHAIHCFNFAQAQQLAMGVGSMIPAPQQQAMSPSQDSVSSIATPGSEGSGMRNLPMSGAKGQNRRPNAESRAQSFNTPMSQDFSQAMMQSANQMREAGRPDFSQMSQSQFNDFLQNSSDGPSHFS